ncbi:MAG: hypothetical protein WCL53_08285 [Chloroflexota bacterium]
MATQYHEHVERRPHRIHFRGIVLLGGCVLALLFALSPTDRSAGLKLESSGVLLRVSGVLLASIQGQ